MSVETEKRFLTAKRMTVFLVFFVLTVLWTAVIFGFSSTEGKKSSMQSQAITERVVKTIDHDYKMPEKLEPHSKDRLYDTIVRKSAHVFSYFLLGVLMFFTVRSLAGYRKNDIFAAKLAIPLCVLVAIADECNQKFTEGRSGRATDVLIDLLGILAGITVCILSLRKASKRLKKTKK
ncbi:MAG: VanZ family protein [Clostridia bacterium]|nr:VanZ family protein [Clostridia bacterium]